MFSFFKKKDDKQMSDTMDYKEPEDIQDIINSFENGNRIAYNGYVAYMVKELGGCEQTFYNLVEQDNITPSVYLYALMGRKIK